MPGPVEHRTVTPIVKLMRDLMRGRNIIEPLRYTDDVALRTQPHPNVPGGPYHKTSKIYYYARDARRLVQPPVTVVDVRQIESEGNKETAPKTLAPGNIYKPDDR